MMIRTLLAGAALAAIVATGPAAMAQGLTRAGWGTWGAVLWQSAGNTLFGYGAWAWLMARYPAATVSPMALLVPVFGMGASALLLAEALPVWKLGAAALAVGLSFGLGNSTLAGEVTRRWYGGTRSGVGFGRRATDRGQGSGVGGQGNDAPPPAGG